MISVLCCALIILKFGRFTQTEDLFIFPKRAVGRPNGLLPCRPCQLARAWLPRKRWRAASALLVGFLSLGTPPPSAVRTACFLQGDVMSQHNGPPADQSRVLPWGEKESVPSVIHKLRACSVSPLTVSVCPALFPSAPAASSRPVPPACTPPR